MSKKEVYTEGRKSPLFHSKRMLQSINIISDEFLSCNLCTGRNKSIYYAEGRKHLNSLQVTFGPL
jgi:hypothetical protein